MFDVSFSELMLIGVVALIVIGPQRLPKVARTLGHLVGRAQRYVNDVKSDIQREINLDEISKVKTQMEDAARSVKSSVNDLGSTLTKPVDEARQAIGEAKSSFESLNLNSQANPAAPEGKPAQPSADADQAAASQDAQQTAEPQNDTLPLPGLEPESAAGSHESQSADTPADTNSKNTGASS